MYFSLNLTIINFISKIIQYNIINLIYIYIIIYF